MACVYDTEGSVEDVDFSAGSSASARSILCNNTTEKKKKKKKSIERTSLTDVIFAFACTSDPFIKSACLLDMVLGYFFSWCDYYQNKMV